MFCEIFELADHKKKETMAGKGDGHGETSEKLEKNISCIKYSLFCFNVIAWVSFAQSRWPVVQFTSKSNDFLLVSE